MSSSVASLTIKSMGHLYLEEEQSPKPQVHLHQLEEDISGQQCKNAINNKKNNMAQMVLHQQDLNIPVQLKQLKKLLKTTS